MNCTFTSESENLTYYIHHRPYSGFISLTSIRIQKWTEFYSFLILVQKYVTLENNGNGGGGQVAAQKGVTVLDPIILFDFSDDNV